MNLKARKVLAISKLVTIYVSFIMVIVLLLTQNVFAWFTNRYESPYYPSIEGADFTLDVNFTGQGSVINMSNGLPVTDQEGINYDGYTFTIENIGNIDIKVNIKVEVYPNDSPYSNHPELIMFRSGEIKYALLLKSYSYENPDDPLDTSTTPNEYRWQKTQNCYVWSGATYNTYECRVGSYAESIYEYDIIPGEFYEFELKFWINNNTRDLKNKMFYGRIVIESTQTNSVIISTTDANPPTLVKGMIPVVWDATQSGWVVIGEWDSAWHNYDSEPILDQGSNVLAEARQWANVVTVSSANVGKYLMCQDLGDCSVLPDVLGTVIPTSEITGMFVWIPRFRYAVKSTIINGAESQIDVVWEHGASERFNAIGKYSGNTPTNFITAAAFLEGERELEGFWISKFELGEGPVSLVSKADTMITTQRADNAWMPLIQTDFEEQGPSYFGFNFQNYDTAYQIKNSQWDAVAFLSQSKYGKFGKDFTAMMPNNNFSQSMATVNTSTQIRNTTGTGGNQTVSRIQTSTSAITSYQTTVKSGYVCEGASLAVCSTYTHDYTTTIGDRQYSYQNGGSGQGAWSSTTVSYSNSTTESLYTDSVLYTNPTYGGNGSTTGNIYGVYDMSMGREEIVSTIYVETGLNHSSVSGLETLKTFAIPDLLYTTLYVAEDGKVYDSTGAVIYDAFLLKPDFAKYEYIIKNTNGFNFTQYEYFDNYYHSYTYSGSTYVVLKGSSMYLLDPYTSGYSLYGAKLSHSGTTYAYVSRGGALSGSVSVVYNITNTADPDHTISVTHNSSLAPYINNSGIFNVSSTRVPGYVASVTSTFINQGSYNPTAENGSESLVIYPTSRVVIVT